MQVRYKSDFPNQVHQLNIFLSQHHYLLKDETIKWQKSKLGVKWDNYMLSGKRHLVSFIVRDHFSNCFYAEMYPVDKMPGIHEFLFNAWSEKEGYEFWGGPQYFMIPKKTQLQFPTLDNFFRSTDKVKLYTPSSGFETGMASVRVWENYIRYFSGFYENCRTISDFQLNIEAINRELNMFPHRDKKESNLSMWMNNQPRILNPGDQERFYGFFTFPNGNQ